MPVQTRRRSPSMDRAAPPDADHAGKQAPRSTKRRRRDPLWARLTVILGALLMMVSGSVIVASKALIDEATSSITQSNLIGDAGKTAAEGGSNLDGPIDMLLLGLDARARMDKDNTRADTIIILHIPATHDQAYLISVPRDTLVSIPASKKSGYGGGRDKINAAFYFGAQQGAGWEGGAQLMASTIKRLTGISFDGAAIIDFNGFKGVIDALGTIRMCVDARVKSIHMQLVDGQPMWLADARKVGGGKDIWYEKGCRQMQGWEALDYSRQRYGLPNGDYDRQRHQQQLIKAMAKKATEGGVIANPLKLQRVIKAAGQAFILDTGGIPIKDFIFTMKGVAGSDLVLVRTNGGTFNSAHLNGASAEALNEQSMQMFQAVKSDTLAEFLFTHPNFISKEK